jgi:hypothetical protein
MSYIHIKDLTGKQNFSVLSSKHQECIKGGSFAETINKRVRARINSLVEKGVLKKEKDGDRFVFDLNGKTVGTLDGNNNLIGINL